MENKVVYKGRVNYLQLKNQEFLALDMTHKPDEATVSFPLSGAFGLISVEEIFKPYLGKDISISILRKEGKIQAISIQEE